MEVAVLTREALPEVIETDRLRLRPWRLGDVEDVLSYAQDPEWSRYLQMLPLPYERQHAEQFIARQLLLDRVTHPAWAIQHEKDVVGGVNLHFDFDNALCEIGYSIARAHWNKGLCTEAVRAVIHAAFSTFPDLNRVHARADERNTASHRVMEKVGMVKEGVMRMSRVERGEPLDEVRYAILRSEWNG